MRTILKIVIALCAVGVLWGFWNTLIKSGGERSAAVDDLINTQISSKETAEGQTEAAPEEGQTEQQSQPGEEEKPQYNYTFSGSSDEKNNNIEELFIDGSAQHNYVDITGGAAPAGKKAAAAPKEDKRKYFSNEKHQKQFIDFDNQYRKRKMSKDELFSELMDAVYFDDLPKALALINRGAPVDSPERNTEFTPVFMAISNGSENMLRMLIEQGASIEIYDDKGYAPIHRAVTGENYTASAPYPAENIIEVLLEYGGDVNYPTKKEGATPLMISAQEHKANIMRFLIDSGANDEIKDKQQHTALDYAKNYECTSCMRILLS
ncbi:ankyrin repeat domain-containing protein [Candidatus Proelusimicrobium excrementi]|uniref:ankyrin repeat domain-containing protein n=1 Tax=Candidatus Proelusimicrobium excrementi TaxID=3416222 RepID=UPI003D09B954